MTLLSDLATLLAPYESGTKVPTTGITIAGTDLSDLYASAASGAATAADTGILVNGVDVADLFAAIGSTLELSDAFKGTYSDYVSGQGTVVATARVSFDIGGNYSGNERTGRYLGVGIDTSLYEIKIELVTGDTLTTNNAATFSSLTGTREATLVATRNLSGDETLISNLLITIREIADPLNKVEEQVQLISTAESWGSSPYPP